MATIQEFKDAIDRCVKASDVFREVISKNDAQVIELEEKTVPSLAKIIKARVAAFDHTEYHGEDAVGITGMSVNAQGQLIVELSDESTFNAGFVTGSDGVGVQDITRVEDTIYVDYTEGPTTELTGFVGEDGDGVAGIAVQPDGSFEVTKADGSTYTVGNISDFGSGAKITSVEVVDGKLSITQNDGTVVEVDQNIDGTAGVPGVSIATAELDIDTDTINITLDDGTPITVPSVTVINQPAEDYAVADTEVSNGNLLFTNSEQETTDLGPIHGEDGVIAEDGTDSVSVTSAGITGEDKIRLNLSSGSTVETPEAVEVRNVTGEMVVDSVLTQDNNLVFNVTVNGEALTINAGRVVGYDGEDGQDGADGYSIEDIQLRDGVLVLVSNQGEHEAGRVGQVRVESAQVSAGGTLTFTLSDDSVVNAGRVDGLDGKAGNLVVRASETDSRDLLLRMLDGTTLNAGPVKANAASAVMVGDDITFTFSDDSTATLVNVKGDPGVDGRDISGIAVVDHDLTLSMSDGEDLAVAMPGYTSFEIKPDRSLSLVDNEGVTQTFPNVRAADAADGVDGTDGVYPVSGGLQDDLSLQFQMSDGSTVTLPGVDGYVGVDGAYPVEYLLVEFEGDRYGKVKMNDDTVYDVGIIDGVDGSYPLEVDITDAGTYEFTMVREDGTTELVTVENADGKAGVFVNQFEETAGGDLIITMSDGTTYDLGQLDGFDSDYITDMRIDGQRNLVLTYAQQGEVIVGLIDGTAAYWLKSLTVTNNTLVATLSDNTTQFTLGKVNGEDGNGIVDIRLGDGYVLEIERADGTVASTPTIDRTVNSAALDGNNQLVIDAANFDQPLVLGELLPGADGVSLVSIGVEAGRLVATLSDETQVDAGELDRVYVSDAYLTDPGRKLVVVLSDGQEFELDTSLGQDGRNLVDAYISAQAELVLTMDNDEVIRLAGVRGNDGANVDTVTIDQAGHLMISLDDATEVDAGFVDADFGFNPWEEGAYNEGQSVVLDGNAYMALVDTEDMPPSDDWLRVRFPDDQYDQRAPILLSPRDGVTHEGKTPYLLGSPFGNFYSVDKRLHRQFQVDTVDGDFSAPVLDDTLNFDGYQMEDALSVGEYKWRARDVNASTGFVSTWSDIVTFRVAEEYVNTPGAFLSDGQNAQAIDSVAAFLTSPFSTTGPNQSHASTSWELIETDTGEVVYSDIKSTVNKTKWKIPFGVLKVDTDYAVRVRHHGSVTDSSWSKWLVLKTQPGFKFSIRPTVTFKGADSQNTVAKPKFRASFDDPSFVMEDIIQEGVTKTQWRIRRTDTNAVVYETGTTFKELVDFTVPVTLESGIEHSVSVRYIGGQYDEYSEWSVPVKFTPVWNIEKPSLSTTFDVLEFPYLGGGVTVTAFVGSNDQHLTTDWEVIGESGEVLASNYNDTTGALDFSFSVNGATYEMTDATIRVRHSGKYAKSEWAELNVTFAEFTEFFIYVASHTTARLQKLDSDGGVVLTDTTFPKSFHLSVDYDRRVFGAYQTGDMGMYQDQGDSLSLEWGDLDGVISSGGGNAYSSMIDTTTGELYIGTKNIIFKITPSGKMLWSYTVPDETTAVYSLQQVADGILFGCYGGNYGVVDTDGNEVWKKDFPQDVTTQFCYQAEDGGFYFGDRSGNLTKLDDAGGVIWEKAYGAVNVTEAKVTTDGILIGLNSGDLKYLTHDGEELWALDYGVASDNPRKIDTDQGGNFYVATGDGNRVIKYDKFGNQIWEHDFGANAQCVVVSKSQPALLPPTYIESKYNG